MGCEAGIVNGVGHRRLGNLRGTCILYLERTTARNLDLRHAKEDRVDEERGLADEVRICILTDTHRLGSTFHEALRICRASHVRSPHFKRRFVDGPARVCLTLTGSFLRFSLRQVAGWRESKASREGALCVRLGG